MRARAFALLKATLIVILGVVGTVAGSVGAIFLTPAGRGLAGRSLSEQLDQLVRGDIQVDAVGGPLWSGLQLDGLVIRDTSGTPILEADHLSAEYHLVELLAGRIVLHDVVLQGPRVTLEKHRDGSWNVSHLFRGSGDTSVGGPPPLIRFQRLTLRDGVVKLLTPWDPPDSMRTLRLAARALAEDRHRPGRVIETGPEGYRKVVTIGGLGGHFATLQLSSPRHDPLSAVFDSLAATVSDPGVELRAAAGHAELAGDHLTVAITRARLPGSEVAVTGSIGVKGEPRYDLQVVAPRVALADLRGIVPGLPDLAGSARASVTTRADHRLAADLNELALRGADGELRGRLTVVTGANQPLGLERMNVGVTRFDPQALGHWIDSIPLHGRLDGNVQANGLLSGLTIDADVLYRDDRVSGRPANHLSVAGLLELGGPDGMVFDSLAIRASDLDLATVRVFVPSNPLVGRASVDGDLDGPWQEFTWRGTLIHRDGDRPVSAIRGTVALDTRDTVPAFDADVGLMPLMFAGLRGSWPSLPEGAVLRGQVHAVGTAERFLLQTDLHGTPGHLAGTGILHTVPGGWGVDSLRLSFDSLDLSAFGDTLARSQLAGTVAGSGWSDSTGAFDGTGDLEVGAGWFREFPLDSARLRIAADPRMLRIDTAFVRSEGVVLAAHGALGHARPDSGTLHLAGDVADLGIFDSLLTAFAGATADTGFEVRPLSGRGSVVADLSGSLDAVAVDAHADVRDLAWRWWRAPSANADVRVGPGADGSLAVMARVDTASWQGWSVNDATVALAGRRDSLAWTAAGRLGPSDTVVSGGAWVVRGDTMALTIDSLDAALTAHRWHLATPARGLRAGRGWEIDSLHLLATDGSGELRAAGAIPADSSGDLTVAALGLDLRDLMGVFQRDTVGIVGRGAVDLHVTGTARAPAMRGTFSLAEGGYRDFRAPYLQGAMDYADRRLRSALQLWRTGRTALAVDLELPLDLALTGVADRKVAGPLTVHATADSADLGILEAFTRNLRQVRGALDADVSLTGSWGATRLDGQLAVSDAAATLPGLGVRWDAISSRIRLSGDSVVVDSLSARGGTGRLRARGTVRFPAGRTPQIDSFTVVTSRFRAMDVRNYLTLVTTANLTVQGPLFGASLTGTARADQGALYFADLITKQIVNLDDPGTADLIDTALVREARLGPSFSNRFIDSLRIDNNRFRFTVGEDFWLRSADANIKLSGTGTVAKRARNYRLDGTLNAERGQYSLKMGPITRDFEVERGTVRFLGTPDLNAELDLTAQHQVKPTDGSPDLNIQARITGTLLVPKLTLSSTENPQMAETDLVSYLMFGRSASSLQGVGGAEGQRQQSALATGMSYFYAALSSEVERTLISDLGVPVDYIQIRPGGFGTTSLEGTTSGLATVTAGWQVGRKTYVALNAGICTNVAELSYRNFGASLEQRLHKDWRATLSVEPLSTCNTAPGSVPLGQTTLYQLGLDLLWDREY